MKILFSMIFTFITSTSFSQICKEKDTAYLNSSTKDFDSKHHILDVYFPEDTASLKPVFVFIHGGSWSGGNKNTYRHMAKNMAKKGFVSVLLNYRMAPAVNYKKMGDDCVSAITWVHRNISKYGGDPNKIVVTGHSAGGQLAAYVSVLKDFGEIQNPIYKTILIDAFGLDMYTYFHEYDNKYSRSLFSVFTKDSNQWKLASPLYALDNHVTIPFLQLIGSKTFAAITDSNMKFYNKIKQTGGKAALHTIEGKKHMGMITQLFFSNNKVYKIMVDFVKEKE